MENLNVLGRKASVKFVDLPLDSTMAKIDTGAYHNAIHCSDVVVEKINGKKYLSFYVLDASHPDFKNQKITVDKFTKTIVKNSFGEFQRRYVVKMRFKIDGIKKIYHSDFTLADRSRMKIPVLIGRKFLKRGFLVDVTKDKI
ncbi:MAG TPA: RimK/LysX family protein [Candidatus Saccharibacteria bacterium]|nr:RimK/LysX family protein [Candidatus Saccharibacteria bacterium]HMT39686.1 RimK/LysX family protein [Candidatus Saccharibacteria bacterium]